MKRPDVGIGYRAAAEVKRLFPKKKHAMIAIGCGKNTMNEWGYGVAPLQSTWHGSMNWALMLSGF